MVQTFFKKKMENSLVFAELRNAVAVGANCRAYPRRAFDATGPVGVVVVAGLVDRLRVDNRRSLRRLIVTTNVLGVRDGAAVLLVV